MNLHDIPAIDQHAHNVLRPDGTGQRSFLAAFTESSDPGITGEQVRHTFFFRRSLREIAELLGCDPTEQAVMVCRDELGLVEVARLCLKAANLESVHLDDGFLPEKIFPWKWHLQFVPVRRILRLEYLAEQLMSSEEDFNTFVDRFRAQLDPPPPEVVALKSIAAYRSGLDIAASPHSAARACFIQLRSGYSRGSIRLTAKPLIDFLLTEALRLAARHHLPVQFHSGFGDPDLDLRLANPLHLRRVLEEREWRNVPVVLLHAGYPFAREAGYLAAVYPQVYLDFGLTVPFLSVAGMRSVLGQLLELAPFTKVMYSSDAHSIPELFYLGAKWGRDVLADVLQGAVADGDLAACEAEAAAERILLENARQLYPPSSDGSGEQSRERAD